VKARRLDAQLSAAEWNKRRAAWRPPAPHYTSGVMAKYAALVSSASDGAITGPGRSLGKAKVKRQKSKVLR